MYNLIILRIMKAVGLIYNVIPDWDLIFLIMEKHTS